jgi:hypothetical protein
VSAASRVLAAICEQEGLRRDGWDHYATSVGDDGRSRFHFDRAPEVGHGGFVVVVDGAGGELELDHDHDFLLAEHGLELEVAS